MQVVNATLRPSDSDRPTEKGPVHFHLHIYYRHASLTGANRPVAYDKCELFQFKFVSVPVLYVFPDTWLRIAILAYWTRAFHRVLDMLPFFYSFLSKTVLYETRA